MSIVHACVHVHMHTCVGVTPNPPYLNKKFEGPNPIGSRDMAHYVIGCKTSNFLIKVWGGGGWGGCLASDPPHHHTLNFQLDFKSKKSSCSLGGGGGGGVWHQTPPTTTPKLQLDFKSKKSSCSLGVVVVAVSGIRPPPTTTP